MNEEMENELNQIDQKYKEAENELKLKQKEMSVLENVISEQVEEINILKDKNDSMVSQISENVRMERKIVIQERVIKELKDKVNDEIDEEAMKTRNGLLKGIEDLQAENKEKELAIQILDDECKEFRKKFDILERQNEESKADNSNKISISISEELSFCKR